MQIRLNAFRYEFKVVSDDMKDDELFLWWTVMRQSREWGTNMRYIIWNVSPVLFTTCNCFRLEV